MGTTPSPVCGGVYVHLASRDGIVDRSALFQRERRNKLTGWILNRRTRERERAGQAQMNSSNYRGSSVFLSVSFPLCLSLFLYVYVHL